METTYETKVVKPEVLKPVVTPSVKTDSPSPDKAKEDLMNKEIQKIRGNYVFMFRGARYRFTSRKQAEIQWRLCHP